MLICARSIREVRAIGVAWFSFVPFWAFFLRFWPPGRNVLVSNAHLFRKATSLWAEHGFSPFLTNSPVPSKLVKAGQSWSRQEFFLQPALTNSQDPILTISRYANLINLLIQTNLAPFTALSPQKP